MIKYRSVIDRYKGENPIHILDHRNTLMKHDMLPVDILAEIELEIPQQLEAGGQKKGTELLYAEGR